MDDLRACIAPFPSLEPRVFSFFFLFTEGIAVIGAEMLQNLIVAGVAVLVVSMLLLANFYAAALVLLVIVSVDVCLLGFLHVRRTCVWFPPNLRALSSDSSRRWLVSYYAVHRVRAQLRDDREHRAVRRPVRRLLPAHHALVSGVEQGRPACPGGGGDGALGAQRGERRGASWAARL